MGKHEKAVTTKKTREEKRASERNQIVYQNTGTEMKRVGLGRHRRNGTTR